MAETALQLVRTEETDAVEAAPKKEKRGTTRADQLSPQQHKCIELMLDGWTQKDIAAEINVAEETISRWKGQRVFSRWLEKQSEKITEVGIGILRNHFTDSIKRVIELSKEPGRVGFDASRQLVKWVLEDNSMDEILGRIEQLEKGTTKEA